jgi:hypothetical protein
MAVTVYAAIVALAYAGVYAAPALGVLYLIRRSK